MQGSSTWFYCGPVAPVESKSEGSRTEFGIDCTNVAAESTILLRESNPADTWQHFCLLRSQAAIAHYNANNPGAEIELVEAGCPRYLVHKCAMWFHFNFKARPKNSDSPDPSPKLYFAEFLHGEKERGEKEHHFTTVCVVDPLDSESTIKGCTSCRPDPISTYHPKDGEWTAGRPEPPFRLPDSSWGSHLQRSNWFDFDPLASEESVLLRESNPADTWQHFCLLRSQAAIAHYNANNPGAEIELVEAGCPRYLVHKCAMWFHFNFKARPKNSDSPNPSPKLYFAEFLHGEKERGEKEHHFTTVCVVDPLDSESTIKGCTSCRPDPISTYHPKDGEWTAGRPEPPFRLPDSSWGSHLQRSNWFDFDPLASEESEVQTDLDPFHFDEFASGSKFFTPCILDD